MTGGSPVTSAPATLGPTPRGPGVAPRFTSTPGPHPRSGRCPFPATPSGPSTPATAGKRNAAVAPASALSNTSCVFWDQSKINPKIRIKIRMS
ncbi:hypothetical protein Acy02nite_20620 [Actinoplanes cyaneus]|uniref:Uncharacterized protein n=1 Tax=Actinoplanes cyaneus TaxID=52696 RepID=A0A919IGY2_9ACTN|nr:hypothetical protein Acy02nite_20620 [Actinoplanes cyaneus]